MKEIIKNNSKIIIAFIIGFIFSGVAVYATTYVFAGSEVSFDNTNANLTKQNGDPVETIQDASDAIYRKADTQLNTCKTNLAAKECADGFFKYTKSNYDYVCDKIGSGFVTLSATSGNINCNDQTAFIATTHYGGTLSCTSSDTSKATCSISGKVIIVNGVGEGSATITVTSSATASRSAASATYNATTGACASWHYYNNYYNASGCQNGCPYYCQNNYGTTVWSCVTSESVAPSEPSLADGGYCWCKY